MNSNPEALMGRPEYDLTDSAKSLATEQIIEFYEAAGMDYGYWSKDFNMHLGFYRRGLNPFRREKMLEQMNLEIADRLQLDLPEKPLLIDLGCGTGAIARTIAKHYPRTIIKGVTIVPWQVELAAKLNERQNLQKQIEILKGDFTNLPFSDGSADGVWAVESLCHAQGTDKDDPVREMARVLKPGGRFAVADCFIKRPEKKFNFLIQKSYAAVCDYWALSEMPVLENFVEALKKRRFQEITVEDISWQVAPSLGHAPFAVLGFICKNLLAGKKLNRHRINNLKASLWALTLGLNRSKFSYCLISGKRG